MLFAAGFLLGGTHLRADDASDYAAATNLTKNLPGTLPIATNLIQILDASGNRGSGNPVQLQWWNTPAAAARSGDYVKVVTWSTYTSSYVMDGQPHTNNWTDPAIFVSAGGELQKYFRDNYPVPSGSTATNNVLVQKVQGMSPWAGANKYFVEIWVKATDLYSPTRDTMITNHTSHADWPDPLPTHAVGMYAAIPDFTNFNQYITSTNTTNRGFDNRMSTDYPYPFTGLGYTYDWSRDGSGNTRQIGLSEFVVNGFSEWIVAGVYSTDTYLYSYIVDQPSGSATQSATYDLVDFSLIKAGAGEMIMNQASQYTNTTTICQGTLTVGADVRNNVAGPLGNSDSTIIMGITNKNSNYAAALQIVSGGVTIERPITVVAGSTGVATLGGINASGTAAFSGAVTLNKDASLTAASGGTVEFSGGISGTGAVSKIGAGKVILSGNNTYSGGTDVQAGSFYNDGTVAGTVTVQPGATLGGGGTFSGAVRVHGILSPGNSPGTLTFGSGLTLYSDASTRIEIACANATGAVAGTDYDKIAVTGSAALNGQLQTVNTASGATSFNAGDTLADIITTTAGTTGAFASLDAIVSQNQPTLAWRPSINGNNVDLVAARDYDNPVVRQYLTPNQRAVSSAVDGAPSTGAWADLKNALNNVNSIQSLADAYQQLSPERLQAVTTLAFAGTDLLRGGLDSRLAQIRSGSSGLAWSDPQSGSFSMDGMLLAGDAPSSGWMSAKKAADDDWHFFINGSGSFGSQDTTPQQTGFDFSSMGFVTGVDRRFDCGLTTGGGIGYARTQSDIDADGGKVAVDGMPVVLYGVQQVGGWHFDGTAGYMLNLYETRRHINFGGLDETAAGDPAGHQLNLGGGTGYDFKLGAFKIGPEATARYSKLWIDEYQETGAGAASLSLGRQEDSSLQSGLGLRMQYEIKTPGLEWRPSIHASWQHEFANDSRVINSSFVDGSVAMGTTQTAQPERDFARVGGGIQLIISRDVSCELGYESQAGQESFIAHSFNGGVRVAF